MPKLDDVLKERENKKFIKKCYRPWDLSGQKLEEITEHKPNTNGTQTEHKPNTNLTQKIETEHKPDTQPNTERNTNGTQMEHKRNTNGTQIRDEEEEIDSISSLVGSQRKVLFELYNNCRIRGSKITDKMTVDHIAELANINKYSVKTTISRLKLKGYISRVQHKNGRGGWVKYELRKDVYSEFLHSEKNINGTQTEHKRNTNGTQTEYKLNTQPNTQPDTTSLSSSSYINKTTTNLPEEWLCINFEPIASIGFSANHLQQLLDKNSPEVVQESIFHFAYSLTHNSKFKNHENPLNLFMGVLRKGNAWIETNYRSAQEMALAQILELKATEQARIKQLQDNAYKISFDEWKSSLSQDEIERIAPKSKSSLAKGGLPERMLLNQFFKETIWPEARKEFNF